MFQIKAIFLRECLYYNYSAVKQQISRDILQLHHKIQ